MLLKIVALHGTFIDDYDEWKRCTALIWCEVNRFGTSTEASK